jgi:uncharacterized membrane protein
VNKFQGENRPDDYMQPTTTISSTSTKSTKGVVTITVAMGGNFVGPQNNNKNKKNNTFQITNRNDLINLLTQIGSDVQLEDNQMMAAEIFWSPEQNNDILTQDEIYYKYPELLPL